MKGNFVEISSVIKPHGYNGQMIAELFCLKDIENEEFIFIETEGYLVPFTIEYFKIIGKSNSIILKLKEINSDNEVKKFVSNLIFSKKNITETSSIQINDIEQIIGFTVKDINHGILGRVSEYLDIKKNPVISIINISKKEILLPINGIKITDIDADNKQIIISTPDGLI